MAVPGDREPKPRRVTGSPAPAAGGPVGLACFTARVLQVVVGALVREGRVLLTLRGRAKRAYPGVWDLPGGHVEPGESELVALRRELHEELGVRIDVGSAEQLCRLTAAPTGEPVLFSAWLVSDWQGTPSNAAPDEHDDVRWVEVAALPPLAHAAVHAALVERLQWGRPGSRTG